MFFHVLGSNRHSQCLAFGIGRTKPNGMCGNGGNLERFWSFQLFMEQRSQQWSSLHASVHANLHGNGNSGERLYEYRPSNGNGQCLTFGIGRNQPNGVCRNGGNAERFRC